MVGLMTWLAWHWALSTLKMKPMNFKNSSLNFSEEEIDNDLKKIRALLKEEKLEDAKNKTRELLAAYPNHYYAKRIYIDCLEMLNKSDEPTEEIIALERELFLKTRPICHLSEAHLSALSYYADSKQYKKQYIESFWFRNKRFPHFIRGSALVHLYLKNRSGLRAKIQKLMARYYLWRKMPNAVQDKYRLKLKNKLV